VGDLTLIATVGVHDPELHAIRSHEPFGEERAIRDERAVGGMPRAVDDLAAVGRPPRPAVVARCRGEPTQVGSVDVHRVDVEVTVLERGEDDAPAIG
jgi:hypothetical protein